MTMADTDAGAEADDDGRRPDPEVQKFLDWLHQHDIQPAGLGQAHIDASNAAHRVHERQYVRGFPTWAITSAHFPPHLAASWVAFPAGPALTQQRRLALLLPDRRPGTRARASRGLPPAALRPAAAPDPPPHHRRPHRHRRPAAPPPRRPAQPGTRACRSAAARASPRARIPVAVPRPAARPARRPPHHARMAPRPRLPAAKPASPRSASSSCKHPHPSSPERSDSTTPHHHHPPGRQRRLHLEPLHRRRPLKTERVIQTPSPNDQRMQGSGRRGARGCHRPSLPPRRAAAGMLAGAGQYHGRPTIGRCPHQGG
jgi:hypothetical protein